MCVLDSVGVGSPATCCCPPVVARWCPRCRTWAWLCTSRSKGVTVRRQACLLCGYRSCCMQAVDLCHVHTVNNHLASGPLAACDSSCSRSCRLSRPCMYVVLSLCIVDAFPTHQCMRLLCWRTCGAPLDLWPPRYACTHTLASSCVALRVAARDSVA